MKKLFIAVLMATAFSANAQEIYTNDQGVALDGYDVVAYFIKGEPVKGSSQFTATYKGATWYFATAGHRDLFKAKSKAYEPECGGWCAWGVAEKNTKFPVDPNTFKISDGKLYLFYNGPFGDGKFNALEPWNKDEKRLMKNMEKNWVTLSKTSVKN